MPQVSVIVPFYNSESFLQSCVDSLVGQSLRDIEILLVDDGSTDQSRALAERIAKSDSRIAVLAQPHIGPGAARNRGIDAARAPYVMFADSDDAATADACVVLLRRAEESGADVVVGRTRGRLDSPAARVQALYAGRISMGVYGKLYRRSFLQAHNIRFPAAIYIEDRNFLLQCLVAEASLAPLEAIVYHRHMRPESAMHRVGAKHIADATAAYELDAALLDRAGLLAACGFHAAWATIVVGRYLARRVRTDAGLRALLAGQVERQATLFRRLPLSLPERWQLGAAIAFLKVFAL